MEAHAGVEVLRVLGAKTLLHYHRPAGPEGRRFPTVVFLHGFPGSEKSVDVQRALLARGIASVAPSFHGAWGSGGRYRFTTLPAQARAALKAARRLSFVDPGRLALYGFSMGGWAALLTAAEERELKAVVAVAPCGGAEMVGPHNFEFIARLARPLNAPPVPALVKDFARAVRGGDPAAAAARLKAPLLLVHGDKDPTIPAAVSRRVAAAAGARATLVIEKGATHDFLDRRDKLARLCADFLAKRLLAALLVAAAAALPRPAAADPLGEAAFSGTVAEAVLALRQAAPQPPPPMPDAKTEAAGRAAVEAALAGKGVPQADVDAFFADPRLRVIGEVAERFRPAPPPDPTKPPPPAMTYAEFRALFINPAALQAADAFVAAHGAELDAAQARFGVDRWLLAGHAGVETRYGSYAGRFPVASALWTIVRKVPYAKGSTTWSNWAARELAAWIVFARAQGLDAQVPLGSYAGAFGYTQFVPTSAAAYAVDLDGDGRVDLWSWPDAIGSTASFLRQNGYRPGDAFTPASSVGRAIYAYNHSDFYVRAVLDLRAEILARQRPPTVARMDLRKRTKRSR